MEQIARGYNNSFIRTLNGEQIAHIISWNEYQHPYRVYWPLNEDCEAVKGDLQQKYRKRCIEVAEWANNNKDMFAWHSNTGFISGAILSEHFPDLSFVDDDKNSFIGIYPRNYQTSNFNNLVGVIDNDVFDNEPEQE